ncbi:MAG TPA: SsrA-binding protein SmpB [Candidatus Limnocylindria bacterium]|nr:SsrA-binding protein SmpB [Candidatus Limnocylindria bacterium]
MATQRPGARPSRPSGRSRSDRPRAPKPPPAEDAPTEIVLADNRKARFNYAIDEKIEAGIALTGTEIKSVRAGRTNLSDGYAKIDRGQIWLRNVHIAPWQNAVGFEEHDPTRPRRLLLHRAEITRLTGALSQQGYTLVPLRLYIRHGVAKVELGLAKGKRRYDKRQTIKERETRREMEAAIKRRVGRGPGRGEGV